MRIKKRLQINFALSLLMVFAIFLLLSISLYRLNKANNLEKIADEIKSGAFERLAFRTDYIRNNADRAKEQWYAKQAQVGRFLESAMENFRSAEERKSVAGLIEVHGAIGRIFSAIVANRERSSLNPDSAALSREAEERLLNQLDMRVYEVAILSRQLLKLSTEKRDSALRLAAGGVLLALLILVASATLNSWAMSRTITSRMLRLRDSATVIGEGNLDHRIDVTGDDEFAEISEAFNTMTAKLRGSYGEMEKEIEERKQVEEELRIALGRLQTFFDNRIGGIGIAIANAKGDIIQANDYYLTILGFTRKELQSGRVDWRQMTPPEWLPADERALAQLRERGVCDTYEKEYVRRDGSRVPVLITDAMMPGDSGDILAFVLDITKRKQAEEAIKKSQKTFAELIERSPFGTYIVDSQFRIAMMNASSQEGAFRNVRPIIGRDFAEAMRTLWPEPVAVEIIGHFRHTLDTGEPYYSPQFINPRHDVEIVESYEWELHRITLPDGQYGVICYYFDSTKLREAEEALRESEAKYRNLFENMTEEVHLWKLVRDENGQIQTWRLVDANPPTLKTWGRGTIEEIRGKTTEEIFGPGATEHYRPVVEKIMTEDVPYSFEDYFPNLDRHFRFTSVPLGEYFITTGADITSIKKAELALRRSEARWTAAIENFGEGAIIATEDEQVIYWNPAARAMHGFKSENEGIEPLEDTPKTFELWTPDAKHLLELEEWPMRRIKRGETVRNMELRLRRPDQGWEKIVAYSGAKVETAGGDRLIFLSVYDLTEQRKAEEALKASLREKEVLLKEIHHRVKNNLQIISSLVALQAEELNDAGMRAILDEVAHRVRSMALVHEKLYQSADLAQVEFAEYAKSLLSYLWRAHEAVASGIRLSLDLEPVSLPVNAAVPSGLILNELVINALKHAFRGRAGGEVTVSLRGSQGEVRMSVRDDGAGLPEGFDWRQANSLGLRLVQMIAGQLHAEVRVNSGDGTEFQLTFRQTTPEPFLTKEGS
jgi:PAS domain S-box-containing protein